MKIMNFKKKEGSGTKSIKKRILTTIIAIVWITNIAIGGSNAFLQIYNTNNTIDETLGEVAGVVSNDIVNSLEKYEIIAVETGSLPTLTDSRTGQESKSLLFSERIENYGLVDAYMVDASGSGMTTSGKKAINISNTDYFKAAMKGETVTTDPILSDSSMKLIVAAPLWKDGKKDSAIAGAVILELDGKILSDIISDIQVGEGGYGFILDKNGNVIAHKDFNKVLKRENTIEGYEQNGSNKELAEIEKKMMSGEELFASCKMDGEDKFITYDKIDGTDGWGVIISTSKSRYMQSTYIGIIICLLISVVSIIISTFVGRRLAKNIGDPVNYCAQRLKDLVKGDLKTEVPRTERNDEIGVLIKSLSTTLKGLNNIVNDITFHLGAIENGNLTTEVTLDYLGDFDAIEWSIRNIILSLNKTMSQIDESAEQVANGSEQVAGGAQALSQGSTEQASSIDELAATINQITEQINNNAKNAENAKAVSLEASKEVENGSIQVENMIKAMDEINKSSVQIGKIIKAIEDIAFQTNILALNAAVEAARAGSAGKGFAVVADEVRNLASKSAEAAKNTTELIENSLKAISEGSRIADKTGESLKLIVEKTSRTVSLVEEIASASEQQALGASQIATGIEQVSAVVQTNSATAEESAAASEELSSQAQVLKNIVKAIKLKI